MTMIKPNANSKRNLFKIIKKNKISSLFKPPFTNFYESGKGTIYILDSEGKYMCNTKGAVFSRNSFTKKEVADARRLVRFLNSLTEKD